jgi:hypothetical protein
LIRNELDDLGDLGIVASFGKLGEKGPSAFSEELYQTAMDSLDRAKDRFIGRRNHMENRNETLKTRLIEQWGGEESYNEMRKRYTNERLEEMLLNKGQFVVEWNNHLVRKETPIYHVPKSKTARAHLFAPVKRVGSLQIDTYWFNMLILWFSALLLYVALNHDLLRRFTNWNQIRKLRRAS